jgi:hypothetical protein
MGIQSAARISFESARIILRAALEVHCCPTSNQPSLNEWHGADLTRILCEWVLCRCLHGTVGSHSCCQRSTLYIVPSLCTEKNRSGNMRQVGFSDANSGDTSTAFSPMSPAKGECGGHRDIIALLCVFTIVAQSARRCIQWNMRPRMEYTLGMKRPKGRLH